MNRLDPKAFIIFYFKALKIMLITLVILIPVSMLFFIPAYFISAYIQSIQAAFYNLIQILLIFYLLFFSLFPLMWGFFSYFFYNLDISEQHVNLKTGIFFRKHIDIPYSHIQSIAILKDPLMEILGLCSIQIDLVATSQKHPLYISGLSVDQAQYIRTMYLGGTKTIEQSL